MHGEGLAPAGGSRQGKGAGADLKQGRARLEVGARARTLNMSSMLAMLERSKFSDALNFFASCRVARRVMWCGARSYGRGGERAVGGGDGANGTQGKARLEVGTRARTLNMPAMLMTLDVTKSSGLLNFFAFCRVAGRAYEAGRGVDRETRGR